MHVFRLRSTKVAAPRITVPLSSTGRRRGIHRGRSNHRDWFYSHTSPRNDAGAFVSSPQFITRVSEEPPQSIRVLDSAQLSTEEEKTVLPESWLIGTRVRD